MLVRCPSCRNTFSSDRTGPQDCPVCGKPLVVPEPPAAASHPADDVVPAGAPPPGIELGTPWERRLQLGLWTAWRDTLVEALFEPAKLFRAARIDRGAAQAGFAVLTVSVFWIAGQMLDRFLLRPWTQRAFETLASRGQFGPMLQKLMEAGGGNSPRTALLMVLLTPVIVLVALYANAAVTHVFALLLGQNKRGFAATFTACAYAFAPLALLAIPGCGAPVAAVWAAILTGIGLKETHRIGSGAAAATVLAPYLLVCCGGCALATLLVAGRGVIPQ